MNVIEMYNEGQTNSLFEEFSPAGLRAAKKSFHVVVVWAPTGQWDTNGDELYVDTDDDGRTRVIPAPIIRPSVSSAAATLGRKGGQARTEKKAAASRKNAKKGGRPVQVDGVIVWDPDYTGGNCHAEWYDSEADAVAAYADFLLDAAKAVIEFDTREGTDEPNDLEEQAKIETAAFVRALRPATRGKLTVTAEGTKYASKNGRMVANGSELVEK